MKSLVLIVLLLVATVGWSAQVRLALVIGNANYRDVPELKNTINDAVDITAQLKALQFSVTFIKNADARTMRRSVNDFLDQVKNQNGIALIYYSGHGVQDDYHSNYLLPIDAIIERESNIRADGISVDDILDHLNQRPDGAVSLLVLDSCRNNPFVIPGAKGMNKGLAPVKVPQGGTLVLYAASPGQTASDNLQERNGLFTKYLLQYLPKPGLDIEDAFEQTAIAVKGVTNSQQLPYKEGNLLGKHYLAETGEPVKSVPSDAGMAPTASSETVPLSPQKVETGPNAAAIEMEFWKSADACGTLACIKSYLEAYPEGDFAPLAKARIQVLTPPANTDDTRVNRPVARHLRRIMADRMANMNATSEPNVEAGYTDTANGGLIVHVNVVAQVQIDGQLAGTAVPGRPLRLPNISAGEHRLVVSASNYSSRTTDVSIAPEQTAPKHIEIILTRK